MMLHVTSIYAGLAGLMLIGLSFAVIQIRYELRVAIGDGGEKRLTRRIRAHANFDEYVPVTLLLMAIAEINGLGAHWLHVAGVALLLGRASHAFALTRAHEPLIFRQIGMVCTFTVLGGLAVANVARGIMGA